MSIRLNHWKALAATLVGLLTATLPGSAGATDLQIRAAEIVAWGVFEPTYSRRFSAGFRTSAPAADSVSNVIFTEFTNEIPGVVGTNFGFQFIINSSPRGGTMDVVQVIRFPGDGIHQPNGRVYTESREVDTIRIGEPSFYGYGFDEAWEIVPGEWVFEVWYKDARIIRKTFTVLPAKEDAAGVASE